MFSRTRRCRPGIEGLEQRLVLSAATLSQAAAPSNPPVIPGPPIAGADNPTLVTLEAFSRAFLSYAGQPRFNAALDLNHNGQIGQDDGRLLLRSLTPLSRNMPLKLSVALAPADRAKGPVPTNSGGVTHNRFPTVEGYTTPGALVFVGTGTLDLKLHTAAVVADANGFFSLKVTMADGINQLDLQAVDAYGHQNLRAFPILWLGFAQYQNAHPRRT